MIIKKWIGILLALFLAACNVGPDYQKPIVEVPVAYKEAPPGWKIAEPLDDCERGRWWEAFQDEDLNELEERVNISNQNIKFAEAQYRQALALVSQARAAYFPILSASGSVTRQQSS